MSRSPSKSHSLALKAAAAIAAQDAEDAEDVAAERSPVESEAALPLPAAPASIVSLASIGPSPATRGRGRPKSRRAVEARHTVYLDAPRHSALTRLAEDRGRSVHSLILEGIDHVIGKPHNPGWQGC